MIESKGGLKTKLTLAFPGLVYVRCRAHSTHLCATHALEEIPKEITSILGNINAMLRSANRAHDFEELQKMLELVVHKILKLSLTRWLSLQQVSERWVEQYDALLEFSADLTKKNNNQNAKEVMEILLKLYTKCYFLLLKNVLGELNSD